jgi:hypothetical protein
MTTQTSLFTSSRCVIINWSNDLTNIAEESWILVEHVRNEGKIQLGIACHVCEWGRREHYTTSSHVLGTDELAAVNLVSRLEHLLGSLCHVTLCKSQLQYWWQRQTTVMARVSTPASLGATCLIK